MSVSNNNDVLVVESDEENNDDIMIQEGGSDNEINETENDFEFKDHNKQNNNNNNANTIQPSQGDEEACTICLEPWTNSGSHRLVCLKCGHLFGESCIDRWIKTNPKCPQCNRPSKRTDIRRIYAKSIKVIDTSELEKALRDIDHEKQERKKAEILASEMKLQFQLVNEELNIVKRNYKELLDKFNNMSANGGCLNLNASILNSRPIDQNESGASFSLEKMLALTDLNGGCRVITYSYKLTALLVSQPSNNPIFPGYGVKKINFLDTKLSQYIPIHSKLIRDMDIDKDDILLTCGMDKLIKLTNLVSNRQIHSFECPFPIWSCTFDTDNPIFFFAGLANGQVYKFDKRKTDGYLQILNNELNTGSPVCSLQFIPKNPNIQNSPTGLLVAQLDKISFYEIKSQDEYKYHSLLIESNIMNCYFEPETRHILVSVRPTQKYPKVRNLVYELNSSPESIRLNLIQTYYGSSVQKMLARSKLFLYNSELYGCSPCEESKTAQIWNVSSGKVIAKLNNGADILDICPVKCRNDYFLCTLTDKQLRIFKKL